MRKWTRAAPAVALRLANRATKPIPRLRKRSKWRNSPLLLELLCRIFPCVERLCERLAEAERSRDQVFARTADLESTITLLRADLQEERQERRAAQRQLRDAWQAIANIQVQRNNPGASAPYPEAYHLPERTSPAESPQPLEVPRVFGQDAVRQGKAEFRKSVRARILGEEEAAS